MKIDQVARASQERFVSQSNEMFVDRSPIRNALRCPNKIASRWKEKCARVFLSNNVNRVLVSSAKKFLDNNAGKIFKDSSVMTIDLMH